MPTAIVFNFILFAIFRAFLKVLYFEASKMAAAVTVSAADLSECIELHAMRSLFLKPISKLVIVVTMPAFKAPGKNNHFSFCLQFLVFAISYHTNTNIYFFLDKIFFP